jgi:toxin HigB-1
MPSSAPEPAPAIWERIWGESVGAAGSATTAAHLPGFHMLDAAVELGDLRAPSGNRLEALRGDLAGLHSIRINAQWRIVFRWTSSGPAEVSVVDYH